MKLLIFTQKVDKNDPILGFFHNWIIKFSRGLEKLTVVCLQKGKVELDPQIKVFSLGKENKKSRIAYVLNFYKYIWQERKNYDAVLVHMNQEYILLGGIFWKLLGKKIFLWRNHPHGSIWTYVAVWFSDKVFCTSSNSFTAQFAKTKILPVGVNTDLFCINETVPVLPNSILSLGRISPIKKIDKMINFAFDLERQGIDFLLDIVGDPVNPEDYKYLETLVIKSKKLIEKGRINFIPAVSQDGAALMFKNHKIFVNLTPSGSMDKTILEAVASGCVPVVVNKFFNNIFEPNMIVSEDSSDLVGKVKFWLNTDGTQIKKNLSALQEYILEKHALNALMKELIKEISNV